MRLRHCIEYQVFFYLRRSILRRKAKCKIQTRYNFQTEYIVVEDLSVSNYLKLCEYYLFEIYC